MEAKRKELTMTQKLAISLARKRWGAVALLRPEDELSQKYRVDALHEKLRRTDMDKFEDEVKS